MAKIVWIGTGEAARRLKIRRQRVKHWAAKGKIPGAYKPNGPAGNWLMPEAAVETLRKELKAIGFSEDFKYRPARARELRLAHRLSVAKVAEQIGVVPRTLMRWEAGETFPAPGPAIPLYQQLLEEWAMEDGGETTSDFRRSPLRSADRVRRLSFTNMKGESIGRGAQEPGNG